MTLPVLSKTWLFQVNLSNAASGSQLTDNRNLLLSIKNALKGFSASAWTVVLSSDSATAGSGDKWITNTNLVWNAAGSAHSWIVLQQTGISSTYQVLISLEPAASNGGSALFALSHAGFTGGTTTARPTATDESVYASVNYGPGAAGTTRVHALMSNDGQSTRIYAYSANAPIAAWKFDLPTNLVTGWTNPSYASVTTGPTVTLQSTSSSPIGRIHFGSTFFTATLTTEGTISNVGPVDTIYGNLANEISGEWPFYPAGVAGTGVGARGRHGSLYDIWWGSRSAGAGNTYPITGTNLFAQFGDEIVPWNGGTPPALA